MKKMWFAFSHEYLNNIRQKGFIFALLSLPLLIGLSIGLGVIIGTIEDSSSAVGYLDKSTLIADPLPLAEVSNRERVEIIQYSSENAALEDLENGKIQAFYVIPPDYPENNGIELYFTEEPGDSAYRDFYDFLQLNLLSGYQPDIRNRAVMGSNLIMRTPDGLKEIPDNNPSVGMFLPLIVSVGFIVLLLISSGYLMGGFLDEKSNRTIEIMVTSLSPAQLVGSKLITMVAMGLTILVAWILIGVFVFFLIGNFLELAWFNDLVINWGEIVTVIAVALPSYLFAAALLLSIGLILGDKQEAESVGPLFFMVTFIPLWFIVAIASEINGPLAIIFSFLPLTSIMTVGLRSMFIHIPLWQVLGSIAIQTLFAIAAIWLAVRTFRIGLLRYGKRIRWVDLKSKARIFTGEEA
jgi:ABC-2 type transport system permease protein